MSPGHVRSLERCRFPSGHAHNSMHWGHHRMRRQRLQPACSQRQPKDPKSWKDMDALRAHLENEASPGFISGVINFISQSAFGAAGLEQPWWSPARLYRQFTWGLRPPDRQGPDKPEDPATAAAIDASHEQLRPLLMLSRNDMRRMSQRYPPVLSMPASEVASRLMDVRDALPGCDACLLVEQYPHLFLSGERAQRRAQVEAAVAQLRDGLKGAQIAEVIMWDAEVLFMDLSHGLSELRELWDVDEQAMFNSEPRHLSLAIRALCNTKKTS